MIVLRDISVSYGEKQVFSHLTFSLPDSGVFALTGPSGSGKTTLLRLLAGLLRPSSGYVEGLERHTVSMVFQEDRLLPWCTAYENVLHAMPAAMEETEETVELWLERLELLEAAKEYPKALSGGMQRRVALARACAYPADMLLLDEPFNGMDEALRERVIPHVLSAAPLILLVTHDLADAKKMGAKEIALEGLNRQTP